MKTISNNKGAIIFIVILIFIFFAYRSFFKPDISNSVATTQSIGQDIVVLYSTLQTVTLDRALFATPGYVRLIDFSVPLPSLPAGRRNPFDLLGAQ